MQGFSTLPHPSEGFFMLTQKAITEYIEIYKKEFGKDISYEEAEMQGISLLRLFKLIYKPIPKEWLKENKTHEKQ